MTGRKSFGGLEISYDIAVLQKQEERFRKLFGSVHQVHRSQCPFNPWIIGIFAFVYQIEHEEIYFSLVGSGEARDRSLRLVEVHADVISEAFAERCVDRFFVVALERDHIRQASEARFVVFVLFEERDPFGQPFEFFEDRVAQDDLVVQVVVLAP